MGRCCEVFPCNCFQFVSSVPCFRYARYQSVNLVKFNGKVCTFLFDLCKHLITFALSFKVFRINQQNIKLKIGIMKEGKNNE